MKEPELNQDNLILTNFLLFVKGLLKDLSNEVNFDNLDALKEEKTIQYWLPFRNIPRIVKRALLDVAIEVFLCTHISGRVIG